MKRYFLMLVIATVLMTTVLGQNAADYNNTCWQATISENTLLMLNLHVKNGKFTFVSRKGSSHDLLGSKYLAGKLLGKVNAHTIEINGTCFFRNDTLFMKGKYESLTSTQDFSASVYNNLLKGTLTSNSITGARINECVALRDYYSIAKSAIDSTENYLYNPAILKTAEWIGFKSKVLKLSKIVLDDYEFEKMFNINGRKLPFTHFGISLRASEKSASGEKSQAVTRKEQPQKFEIKRTDDETVVFTVRTFSASAEEIIPFIDTLKTMTFSNLIIDLRRNTGGTIASALPLAEYLVQDTLMGGAFLTQKYFSKHSVIPEAGSYNNFPLFSEASFSLIISGIHNQEGLCLIIYPDAKSFKGDLYILTDKHTASTCEPLVYGLKTSKRATVIGEKTYGAMLNGEIFGIGDSFNLWIPTADYYAADGFKIDKVGVTPDIEVDPANALDKALEVIQGKKR